MRLPGPKDFRIVGSGKKTSKLQDLARRAKRPKGRRRRSGRAGPNFWLGHARHDNLRKFDGKLGMQQITDQTIDLINDRIQHMDEGEIGKIWDSFAKEQPALVGYVLGESRELEMPDAREDVAYVLTIILLTFREMQPGGIPSITEIEFEKAFNEEFDEMENSFQNGFDESDAMAVIASFCQPDLLQFAAATIYSDSDDEDEASNFTEEEAGLFIVIFKTAISLLHRKAGSII
jgi:hypothetical protein